MGFMFEKLNVYQKALRFTKDVYSLTGKAAGKEVHLVSQIRRASSSIPLNIAEGNGRWTKKDRRNLFVIARGSCFECIPALELLHHNGTLENREYTALKNEIEIIAKMLTALIRNTR